MADNLRRRTDHIEDFETEHPPVTNYQDYQDLNSNSIKLQDMISLDGVSETSVLYSLVAFFFLVAQVPSGPSSQARLPVARRGGMSICNTMNIIKHKNVDCWSTFSIPKKKHHVLLYYLLLLLLQRYLCMLISSTIFACLQIYAFRRELPGYFSP